MPQPFTTTLSGKVQSGAPVDAIFVNNVQLDAFIIFDIPAPNAGKVIGEVTVRTKNGKPYLTPLQLQGPNAADVALDNGGVAPCNLVIGPNGLDGDFVVQIVAP